MPQAQRLQRYFSPLLIGFLVIVVVLVAAVLYVAFSKTTITVTLRDVPATVDFQYSATELGIEPQVAPIAASYTYTDYEADSSEDAIARGTVTLVNEYSGNQALVRTTRLLSTEGVLFHTDETVTVPAGGSIEVPVYADQPGVAGNIAASKFEIVALDASLKDQIYGTSAAAMTGGVIKKVTLTEELIEAAKTAAQTAAIEAAETSLAINDAAAENWQQNITEQIVNGSNGDVVDAVTVQTTGSATYLPFTAELIRQQLQSEDQPVADDSAVTYQITTDGTDWIISGTAGTTALDQSVDFVDAADLTGKTEQQVKEYLADFEQVDTVTVHFVPFWVDRTPKLPQQIHLVIFN